MRPPSVLLILATLAAGCGQALGGGTSVPDRPISHPVDPRQPVTPGGASWVTPVPGDGSAAPISPVRLRAGVRGGRAFAVVTWWGGIAPCYVLRPVRMDRSGTAIRLTVREGSDAAPGTACVELAQLKRTRIDLGRLAHGTYTVLAGARRATLTVQHVSPAPVGNREAPVTERHVG